MLQVWRTIALQHQHLKLKGSPMPLNQHLWALAMI